MATPSHAALHETSKIFGRGLPRPAGVVDLSWQMPSSDGDSPIDAYRVQRMKEWPGTFLSLGPRQNSAKKERFKVALFR